LFLAQKKELFDPQNSFLQLILFLGKTALTLPYLRFSKISKKMAPKFKLRKGCCGFAAVVDHAG